MKIGKPCNEVASAYRCRNERWYRQEAFDDLLRRHVGDEESYESSHIVHGLRAASFAKTRFVRDGSGASQVILPARLALWKAGVTKQSKREPQNENKSNGPFG